jgi:hypothetical protein
LDLSFPTHRKRKKLFNTLGAQGVLSLIDLWLATAANRPKGILSGMDEADIALDAQWSGDPAQFCKVLCEVGFLDQAEDGTYLIHDWKDHQPFAFYAEERSQKSRELAFKRWGKKTGSKPEAKTDNADGMRDACERHNKGNAPIPSPIPSPIPKKTLRFPSNGSFDRFWFAYPRKRAKQSALKAWQKIKPDDSLLMTMLKALEHQKSSQEWQKDGGQFIPYPATWLNGRRWEDEPLEVKPSW